MKKISILALAISALAFLSCARNQPLEEQEVTITATIGPATKTALDGYAVVWEKGDQIMVRAVGYSKASVFTLKDEDAGKTTGRFTGTIVSATSYQAIYPASVYEKDQTYRDYFVINIPGTQNHRSGNFGKGANIAFAESSDLNSVWNFYNTGGLLKLTLKGSGASIASIELTSNYFNEIISGKGYLDRDFLSSPDVNYRRTTESSNAVTLDCGSGAALDPDGTDFFFFLPYGSMSYGFEAKIYDTAGGMMIAKAPESEQNRIVRSGIKAMPALTYKAALPTAFLKKMIPGEYDNCFGTPALSRSYIGEKTQTGVTSSGTTQVFSIKSWEDEFVTEYRIPADLTSGETYEIQVVPVIGNTDTGTRTLNLEFLASENGLGWFYEESADKGYIFNLL